MYQGVSPTSRHRRASLERYGSCLLSKVSCWSGFVRIERVIVLDYMYEYCGWGFRDSFRNVAGAFASQSTVSYPVPVLVQVVVWVFGINRAVPSPLDLQKVPVTRLWRAPLIPSWVEADKTPDAICNSTFPQPAGDSHSKGMLATSDGETLTGGDSLWILRRELVCLPVRSTRSDYY
jgi:hypothetical protein